MRWVQLPAIISIGGPQLGCEICLILTTVLNTCPLLITIGQTLCPGKFNEETNQQHDSKLGLGHLC